MGNISCAGVLIRFLFFLCSVHPQREVGLWHAVLSSVLNGMHSIFIPYALMKTNPASWMHMITKYKGAL